MNRHPSEAWQDSYYDLIEDYPLIEASFATQYGIRLAREEDMSWLEFSSLLSGIMGDTPLGRVVAIRAEKDLEKIKNFTPEQRAIRNEWILKRNKKMREDPKKYARWVNSLQKALQNAFQ